jgi:transcriptional regulator with XRE-family HTH domain
LAQIPKIIEFLECNPFEAKAGCFSEKLKYYRQIRGLSLKKFAAQLGVDFTTLAGWGRGEHKPSLRLIMKLSTRIDPI